MPRFIGIKNNTISLVSDRPFNNTDCKIIEVPKELEHVSAAQLITDFRFADNQLVPKVAFKNHKDLKVAVVGNWKMRCGISTYSEKLWPFVLSQVANYKLFVEENDLPTGPINLLGGQYIDESKVVTCWKRGESPANLIEQLKEYNPDIIWIQHEFGLWPNARQWLSMLTQLSDYRVIVTMHSVFHHKDKTICEAAMPEIVVHLEGAHSLLKEEKGVPGIVHVVPHGCDPYTNPSKLWNFYKSNKTFLQFGFGFRYKGWENSIRATAILAKKYPDVFFTGLFSESPFNKVEHQLYFNELKSLISELHIEPNVSLIRGYQSDTSLDSFLRTNQATVFPYISFPEHEVFGASGAARLAMSNGLPVITSRVNHFSDLPTIKASSPEEIAAELEKVFISKQACQDQIDKQINYLNDTTWEKIAGKYLNIFDGNEITDKK
jgi:glycosyltransferase involved in cell wall biosynthesis